MTKLFSYVKYSEASFQMSNEYIALLIITTSVWILLWLGYRKNKINDENKMKEKQAHQHPPLNNNTLIQQDHPHL